MSVELDYRITAHFTVREACRSHEAERYKIDNSVHESMLPTLFATAYHLLEPIRAQFGAFTPSSWYRCLELNRAIMSKDTSQHVKGQAVDIVIPHVSTMYLAEWVVGNLSFDQIILEFYRDNDPFSGWVHVSYVNESENRKSVLRTPNGRDFAYGLKGN